METQQVASELSKRIDALANFDGESLKHEMAALKEALLQNPAACSLLGDEDIGKAVLALRRLTGIAIAAATAKAAPKPKTPKVSKSELNKLLSELSDEEFL